MHHSVWTLEGHRASWRSERGSGFVDADRPDWGVLDLRVEDQALDRLRFFQVGPVHPNEPWQPSELYIRDRDLIATYRETEQRPFSWQIYWRLLAVDDPAIILAMELQAAVKTDRLDSRPALATWTTVESEESYRQTDPQDKESSGNTEFHPLPTAAPSFDLGTNDTYFVHRLTQVPYSLIELFPAGDSSLPQGKSGNGRIEVRYPLIGSELEKGVILKARMRALLVDRDRDLEIAASANRDFRAARLPLTT